MTWRVISARPYRGVAPHCLRLGLLVRQQAQEVSQRPRALGCGQIPQRLPPGQLQHLHQFRNVSAPERHGDLVRDHLLWRPAVVSGKGGQAGKGVVSGRLERVAIFCTLSVTIAFVGEIRGAGYFNNAPWGMAR